MYFDHTEFSDLTDLIDHRKPDLNLRFTINPNGGTTGSGRLCHDLIDSDGLKKLPQRSRCVVDIINLAHSRSQELRQISSAASI